MHGPDHDYFDRNQPFDSNNGDLSRGRVPDHALHKAFREANIGVEFAPGRFVLEENPFLFSASAYHFPDLIYVRTAATWEQSTPKEDIADLNTTAVSEYMARIKHALSQVDAPFIFEEISGGAFEGQREGLDTFIGFAGSFDEFESKGDIIGDAFRYVVQPGNIILPYDYRFRVPAHLEFICPEFYSAVARSPETIELFETAFKHVIRWIETLEPLGARQDMEEVLIDGVTAPETRFWYWAAGPDIPRINEYYGKLSGDLRDNFAIGSVARRAISMAQMRDMSEARPVLERAFEVAAQMYDAAEIAAEATGSGAQELIRDRVQQN